MLDLVGFLTPPCPPQPDPHPPPGLRPSQAGSAAAAARRRLGSTLLQAHWQRPTRHKSRRQWLDGARARRWWRLVGADAGDVGPGDGRGATRPWPRRGLLLGRRGSLRVLPPSPPSSRLLGHLPAAQQQRARAMVNTSEQETVAAQLQNSKHLSQGVHSVEDNANPKKAGCKSATHCRTKGQ